MPRSAPVDGFSLSWTDDQSTEGATEGAPAVVLLHGWPGDSHDYRLVRPLLSPRHRVVVPDLRGFGESDRWLEDPTRSYSASAQAASVAGLIEELGLERPVVAGYDVGTRVAQTLAAERPELVGALALSPPLPGAGRRVLDEDSVPEFWYQHFHRSPLAVPLVDGRREAVHDYLRYFWEHWSGPGYEVDGPELERLVDAYSRPGAFEASINWYRAGGGFVVNSLAQQAPAPEQRLQQPTHVLWPEHDPLFPPAWSDRLDEFFARVTLRQAPGVGHFTPLEAPEAFAELVEAAARDL